jgi:hypothetical protein
MVVNMEKTLFVVTLWSLLDNYRCFRGAYVLSIILRSSKWRQHINCEISAFSYHTIGVTFRGEYFFYVFLHLYIVSANWPIFNELKIKQ